MTTYSPIAEKDLDAVIAMMRDFYAIDAYPMDEERAKELFVQFIENPHLGRSWLIEADGRICGYVILTFIFSFEFGGNIAFVDELYLEEAARGKGLGKSSIDFMKSEAQKLGLKLLYLEVEHHNASAKQLYLNKGFTEHKRQLLSYQINNNSKL